MDTANVICSSRKKETGTEGFKTVCAVILSVFVCLGLYALCGKIVYSKMQQDITLFSLVSEERLFPEPVDCVLNEYGECMSHDPSDEGLSAMGEAFIFHIFPRIAGFLLVTFLSGSAMSGIVIILLSLLLSLSDTMSERHRPRKPIVGT